MADPEREQSIDVFRGIIIIMMLYFNDFTVAGLRLTGNLNPGMNSDAGSWIFTGFLFLSGMAIPYAIDKRFSEGQDKYTIARHIATRTISLLIIGILIINTRRIDRELTGFGTNLWSLLMCIGIFLTWNDYRENENNFFTITGLKLTGMALLTFLVFRFRSGEPVNEGSLITGSWGVTGIIGWGYFITALIYLLSGDELINTIVALIFFLSLSVLTGLNMLTLPGPLKSALGIITTGNIPVIVISGMLITQLMKKYKGDSRMEGSALIIFSGVAFLSGGLILHNLKSLQPTEEILIMTGTCILVFVFIHFFVRWSGSHQIFSLISPTGSNTLTVFLLALLIYYILSITGLTMFLNKQPGILTEKAGPVIWTITILILAWILRRKNIRVKL